MSDLENTTPADTYKDLFRLVNNGLGLDSTLRNITGGDGSPTGVYVSNSKVQIDMNKGILRRPVIRDGNSLYINLGNATGIENPPGTLEIDLEAGDVFKIELDTNITTLNFTNEPNGISSIDGRSKNIIIIVEQKTTGTPDWANIVWGANILWPASLFPEITTTNGAIDVFRFTYVDDGSTSYWFGEVIGQDMRSD